MLSGRLHSCIASRPSRNVSLRRTLKPYFSNPFNSSVQSRQAHYSPNISPSVSPTMPKRKSSALAQETPLTTIPIPPPTFDDQPPPPKRRASQRKVSTAKTKPLSTNPDENANVLDAPEAMRASPDADEPDERMDFEQAGMDVDKQVKDEDLDEDGPALTNGANSESSLSDLSDVESPAKTKPPAKAANGKASAKTNGVTEEKSA